MFEYFDDEAFSEAVELLKNAPRIGASGCGHSGILCQHFAHLMCCIEQPAKFVSPAEAVHGGMGFLQEGDVMVFASRGGKTKELLPILDICKRKEIKDLIAVLSKDYPDLKTKVFGAMQRLPLDGWKPDKYKPVSKTKPN